MTRRDFVAALCAIPAAAQSVPARLAYGTDRLQFGHLRVPAGAGPHPVVIFLHGGFWRNTVTLEASTPACEALTRSGAATWNLEFRRLGDAGGGWMGTFEDVLRGGEHVVKIGSRYALDSSRIVVTGHGSGGHLALWLAAQRAIDLRRVIGLAAISDLRRGWALNVGNGAVGQLLGGSPEKVPQRYGAASPADLLPISVKQRLVHGTADEFVPYALSEYFARSSHNAELIPVSGARDFDVIDPHSRAWPVVEKAILDWKS